MVLVYEMFNSLWYHLISEACFAFFSSAVMVPDSQAYGNMAMTRGHFDFWIGFRYVRAAVACVVHERTSGFEPLCETTASKNLQLVTDQLLSLYLYLPLDAIGPWRDATVYKIMLSRWFCSHINLKPTLWYQIFGCLAISKTAVTSWKKDCVEGEGERENG